MIITPLKEYISYLFIQTVKQKFLFSMNSVKYLFLSQKGNQVIYFQNFWRPNLNGRWLLRHNTNILTNHFSMFQPLTCLQFWKWNRFQKAQLFLFLFLGDETKLIGGGCCFAVPSALRLYSKRFFFCLINVEGAFDSSACTRGILHVNII